jgi:hypothetical protein
MDLWGTYGKTLVALLVALGAAVSSALVGDNWITAEEWVQVVIQLATAAGVWLVPLVPGWRGAKTGVAAVLAAANFAATALADGPITQSGWINIVLAGLGVILVGAAPAQSVGTVTPRATRYPTG